MSLLKSRRLNHIISKLGFAATLLMCILLISIFHSKLRQQTVLLDLLNIHGMNTEELPIRVEVRISVIQLVYVHRRVMRFDYLADGLDPTSFERVLLGEKPIKAAFLSVWFVEIVSILKLKS